MYSFHVDEFSIHRISGWCYEIDSSRPTELSLEMNGISIGSLIANDFRFDLRHTGNNGFIAFDLTLNNRISGFAGELGVSLPKNTKVALKIKDSGEVIYEQVWNAEQQSTEARFDHKTLELTNLQLSAKKRGLTYKDSNYQRFNSTLTRQLNYMSQIFKVCEGRYLVSLSYGSLLGQVRDSSIIPNDDDIDLMVIFNAESLLSAFSQFYSFLDFLRIKNFKIKFHSVQVGLSAHVLDPADGQDADSMVDIFFGWINSKNEFRLMWAVSEPISASLILPLISAEFEKASVQIPFQAKEFLKILYGENWRIVDPYFKWNFSDLYSEIIKDLIV